MITLTFHSVFQNVMFARKRCVSGVVSAFMMYAVTDTLELGRDDASSSVYYLPFLACLGSFAEGREECSGMLAKILIP